MTHAGLTWSQLQDWMRGIRPPEQGIAERYNVPPTSLVPILRRDEAGLAGDLARWGLIPAWHRKSLRDWKANTINARVETVATAPSFRQAFRTGRCAVIASGYYEWQSTDGSRQPHYIHPAGNAPALLMAGLWSAVELPDFEGLTCAVLTEAARPGLDALHDRMPVIIDQDGLAQWLDGCEISALPRLPVTGLAWHPVDRAVGSVRNEGPKLIEPV
jgi:putative SOS response-associated peptidase YedK